MKAGPSYIFLEQVRKVVIEGLKNHRHLKIPVDQIMVSFSQCIRSNATVPVTFSVTMILKNSQKRTENGVSLPNGPHKETKKCLDQKVPVFLSKMIANIGGIPPAPLAPQPQVSPLGYYKW